MRLFLLLSMVVTTFLFASNPFEDISIEDKINALSKHIYSKESKKSFSFESKGEFETQAAYNAKRLKAKELFESKEKIEHQKKNAINTAMNIILGEPSLSDFHYDAEKKEFRATLHTSKNDINLKTAIPVSIDEAKEFKEHISEINTQLSFTIYTNELLIEAVDVAYGQKLYSGKPIKAYSVKLHKTIIPDVADNKLALQNIKDPTAIAFAGSAQSKFDDDLGYLLSRAKPVQTDNSKWAIIIGIENYKYTDNIIYAARSAKTFEKIVQKRLGVPKKQTFTMLDRDATLGNIKNKLRHLAPLIKEGDTVIFYYNGHGIPVPSLKNEPFMLASDIEPDYVQDDNFFSLKNIYKQLESTKAAKIIAVVDSCFSGGADGKTLLKGVAATRLKAKSISFNKDKMAILTAGKGTQYSNAYREKGHRLFSYHVMKSLIQGETSIYDLYKKSFQGTKEVSQKMHGALRVQEPTLSGNAKLNL